MQAVPEADAGPNAYLGKDVEEWMNDDEESFVFLLSRLEIQASTSSIGSWLCFNQFASIALLQKLKQTKQHSTTDTFGYLWVCQRTTNAHQPHLLTSIN